jgi:hypothetical protein
MKRTRIATAVLIAASTLISPAAISASYGAPKCPIVSKPGAIAGSILVDKKKTWIEFVNYPAGGELLPPVSTEVAGLSMRHQKLSATNGSSVIIWHKDLNGCVGRMEQLTLKKVGETFSITDEKGHSQKYKITQVNIVKIGQYKKSWFYLSGPRKLVLITCHGKIVKKHYQENQVFIAVPTK